MANEFTIIPAPDVEPIRSLAGVSTGYIRQNTLLSNLQTGIDTTEPYDNGSGVITIPAGGVVEANGVLFKLTANVTLNKGSAGTAYWIGIQDNGDGTASAVLVTRPGVWNPAKQGCYRASGARTLNWVSLGTLSGSPGTAIFSRSVKGTWTTNMRKGWYYVELASGKGGGNGGHATATSEYGGDGGVANVENVVRRPIFIGLNCSALIVVGGTGFSGGTGGRGQSSDNGGAGGGGGSGGGEKSFIKIGKSIILKTSSVAGGNGGNGANGRSPTSTILELAGGGGGGGVIGGTGGSAPGSRTGRGGNGGSNSQSGQNGTNGIAIGGIGGSGNPYLRGASGGGGGGGGRLISNGFNQGFAGGSAGISSDGDRGRGRGDNINILSGAGGGGQGAHGRERPIGGLGGRCYIYQLGN